MNFDDHLNATGALCPIPVLKAQKRLKKLKSGDILNILADDPAAVIDFPHFCSEQGHTLIKIEDHKDCKSFFIRKT
ncbi:SirA family protein [Rhodobacterales bacterium HTCC2255]|nr:SirA family protein [Rhodobacterales bacterium HTCC2255]